MDKPSRMRRTALALIVLMPGLVAGCASLGQLESDVMSFGDWPASRAPGTYAFERLPSQKAKEATGAKGVSSDHLEEAARAGLQAAGFQPVEAGREPDVLVQIGARLSRTDLAVWNDPLWWRGGFGPSRYRGWHGPYWGPPLRRWDMPRYEREVAVLLRDRATGQPLYEGRASSEGSTTGGDPTLRAMFTAALKDFPRAIPESHTVRLPLAP